MIFDANGADSVDTHICIIGGGAAGINIAERLRDGPTRVTLVVGGEVERESTADVDLNRGGFRPGAHEPLEENRRRVFGGSSTAWGGRCIPFDEVDFEERHWMPGSGWPIQESELHPYLEEALEILEAGPYRFDARIAFPDQPPEIVPGMDGADFQSWKLERWSTPVDFGRKFRASLEGAANVTVMYGAHATEIVVSGEKVVAVKAQANGRPVTIRCRKVVLAAGGIENARLLLASKSEAFPQGLGNNADLVGRFYQCHPHGIFTTIQLTDGATAQAQYVRDGEVYCRRRWWVTPDAQARLGIGNTIFFLDRTKTSQGQGHRDPFFSAVYLAKFIKSLLRPRSAKALAAHIGNQRRDILMHLGIVARGGFSILPRVLSTARARFDKRRLPSVLPAAGATEWGLYIQAEQQPNRDSRIMLSDTEADAHGMPRAIADLRFTDVDRRTVVEGYRLFFDSLTKSGAGTVAYSEQDLARWAAAFSDNFNSAAHHLGTTRMATSAETGVVDRNLRVFGVENLYVVGGSVFPTGGHANPMLMVVALALRLAAHLSAGASA